MFSEVFNDLVVGALCTDAIAGGARFPFSQGAKPPMGVFGLHVDRHSSARAFGGEAGIAFFLCCWYVERHRTQVLIATRIVAIRVHSCREASPAHRRVGISAGFIRMVHAGLQ